MDSSLDRIQEPTVSIRRKIHHKLCGRSQRAGDFDIEHHFTIGATGVASRVIMGAIDCNGLNAWHCYPQLGKVGREILWAITTSQLDNGNALSMSIDPGRKVIEPG
jgi:hypothetical protein